MEVPECETLDGQRHEPCGRCLLHQSDKRLESAKVKSIGTIVGECGPEAKISGQG